MVDVHEATRSVPEDWQKQRKNSDIHTSVGLLNITIKEEIDSLQGVDAAGLSGSFGAFLNTYNCPFIVHCESINVAPEGSSLAERMRHSPDPAPSRSFAGGLWHDISATPRAIIYTVKEVVQAGYWAVTMFLACTILWFAMLFRAARGSTPIVAFIMLLGAPLGIGMMVILIQWLCAGALNALGVAGCVFAILVMAVIHGTAFALLVGAYDVLKGPREIVEGFEKFKET